MRTVDFTTKATGRIMADESPKVTHYMTSDRACRDSMMASRPANENLLHYSDFVHCKPYSVFTLDLIMQAHTPRPKH